MSPQQKAQAMIDTYYREFKLSAPVYIADAEKDEWMNLAKQCALIAVEEIFTSHFKKYKGYGEHADYYQQVKEAIQNHKP
jgi:hypothetical protein